MIRKGEQVVYLAEWQDPGDRDIVFVAIEDEDGGRIKVRALLGLPIDPVQVVEVSMIAPRPAQSHAPLCRRCGWRTFGPDSWDGKSCKCKRPI